MRCSSLSSERGRPWQKKQRRLPIREALLQVSPELLAIVFQSPPWCPLPPVLLLQGLQTPEELMLGCGTPLDPSRSPSSSNTSDKELKATNKTRWM